MGEGARGEETHADEVDGRRDVVLVVLDGLLCALPDGLVGSDCDHCVDAALGLVRLEDPLNVVLDRDVALKEVDLAVGLVGVGGIGRERVEGELGDTVERGGEGVGEAGEWRASAGACELEVGPIRTCRWSRRGSRR